MFKDWTAVTLKEIARDKNASAIFVLADMEDEAALALYRKLASEEIAALHFEICP